jgi:hypothetical protein
MLDDRAKGETNGDAVKVVELAVLLDRSVGSSCAQLPL